MQRTKRWLGLGLSLICLGLGLPARSESRSYSGYQVAKGDCLWKIAADKAVFGDPWKWPLIYEANRGLIKDPDKIEVGWSLQVPLAPSAAEVASAIRFAQDYKEPGRALALTPVRPPLEGMDLPVLSAKVPAAPVSEAPPATGWGWTKTGLALLALLVVVGTLAAYRQLTRQARTEQPAAPAAPESRESQPPLAAAPPAETGPADQGAEALATPSEEALRADEEPGPALPEAPPDEPEEEKKAA